MEVEPKLVAPAGDEKLLSPLSQFVRLSKVVRLYQPTKSTQPFDATAPTTILFCSWMDAHPKHIAYYTKAYMSIYPHARIILATMTLRQFMAQSEATRQAEATEAVTALLSLPQENERLLIHCLSNGGAKRVYSIAGVYQKVTGNPLPVKAMVIDSAPGIPQFRRDLNALSVPARKLSWPLWVPYMGVVVVVASAIYVSVHWMPKWWWRELVWGPHEGVNDHALINSKCVKGFVYSKEDIIIDWRDVESHTKLAEEKGYRVERKMIEGAEHVKLFKGAGGEKDYWGFVKMIWDMAMK
ncbi:indole-diterpene biosynthesis protein [Venturia nashicola]|uniref:Indole-diterpene biosynthesis protein n=1 Tax=Venturia nashicola TaxID=86259 RepID=A0A4Z1P8G0_9PEZI|nr:indole-diterpene biosynthesis protein [Venturia nashicola]TLD28001.1 indole-diterpene biosynthesis protein [Venturia nashicola]